MPISSPLPGLSGHFGLSTGSARTVLGALRATVAPTGTADPLPSVTRVHTQAEPAGPDKIRLANAPFRASRCLRSAASPIMLRPVLTDPGAIDAAAGPDGPQAIIASFPGATHTGSTFPVSAAKGYGGR
jgi:hypothetical protein